MKVNLKRFWRDQLGEDYTLDAEWNPDDCALGDDGTVTLSVTGYHGVMVRMPDGSQAFQAHKRRQNVEIIFTAKEARALIGVLGDY